MVVPEIAAYVFRDWYSLRGTSWHGTHYAAHIGLKLLPIFLSLSSKCSITGMAHRLECFLKSIQEGNPRLRTIL